MPSGLGISSTSAPNARIVRIFSSANASEDTIRNGYPLTAQTNARDEPVLPPVYSTTGWPGSRRPSASAASIIASAIRSLYEPVGLAASIFTQTSAQPSSAMLASRTTGVPPIAEIPPGRSMWTSSRSQQLLEQAFDARRLVVGEDGDAGRLAWEPGGERLVARVIARMEVGRLAADRADEVAVSVAVAGQPPAAGVVVAGLIVAGDRRVRRAHQPQRADAEQRPRVQGGGVAGQVAHGGAQIAGARYRAQVPRRYRPAAAVAACHRRAGRYAADGGRGQPQRGQDSLGEEVRVGTAA